MQERPIQGDLCHAHLKWIGNKTDQLSKAIYTQVMIVAQAKLRSMKECRQSITLKEMQTAADSNNTKTIYEKIKFI